MPSRTRAACRRALLLEPPPALPAYGRLLLDAWERDLVPLQEYPVGSDGPPPRPHEGEQRPRSALLHPGATPYDAPTANLRP